MTKILDHYHKVLNENNIKPSQAQEQILKALGKLHQQISSYLKKEKNILKVLLPKRTAPEGFYLYGSVGTGKSVIVDLFFESLTTDKKQKIHFHSFMLEIHHHLHKLKNTRKDVDVIKYIAQYIKEKYTILYIDELYISDIADAMIVGKLFRELIAHNVIIIITSNFAPEDLYKDGLQRGSFLPFIELIMNKMQVIKMDSDHDYRTGKLKSVEATYYVYKEIIDSQKFILDSFRKLSNNAPAKNSLIDCDGRELICPITALDCAVFSFDQLCRAPLSSIDYIAICEKFNVIILSEIPELSSDEHNEARRLTKLIDTIYEFKLLLICSSEVEIDSIYKKGKWSFEFTRTASRLHEMQSDDYLSRHYSK